MMKTATAILIILLVLVLADYAVASYTDHDDGTVTDNGTGLMWQKCSAGQDYLSCSGSATRKVWADALAFCNNLDDLGGWTDWRLPDVIELKSLIDISLYDSGINTIYFPNTALLDYWSSTTYVTQTDHAWFVYIPAGVVGNWGKDDELYVRCVRGGIGQGCINKPVEVGDDPAAYDYIQDGYTAAASSETVRAQADTFSENLIFENDKIITLIGGYDCYFTSTPGLTTVNGSLTISGGAVTVENILIM
jgi:hypothetical protein